MTDPGQGFDSGRLHLLADPEQDTDAELVVGLVSPLGTPLDGVVAALVEAFDAVRYTHHVVHVSNLLASHDYQPYDAVPDSRGADGYYRLRMDAGDRLRQDYQTGAALAAMAIGSLRDHREELSEKERAADQQGEPPPSPTPEPVCPECPHCTGEPADQTFAPRARHVTIIRTLKHPDEVRLLRSTYGSRFVLLGATGSAEDRRAGLESRLRDERSAFNRDDDIPVEAARLLGRDAKDAADPYGQNVRDTFEMADYFVGTARGVTDGGPAARRLVELVFGRPFLTPTRDEMAMALARATALRSADAGRQVGAVITSPDGQVLAAGCNEVPKPGGGQYWADDDVDQRDFLYSSVDPNDRLTARMLTDMFTRLGAAGWLSQDKSPQDPHDLAAQALHPTEGQPRPPLKGSRLTALMEFARVVHAEMAALSDSARRGTPVQGATLYTTSFPCHECARHIVAAGIARVVYVSPYPKSLVPELFEDSVAVDPGPDTGGRTRFEPFTGVAPTLYDRLFQSPPDPGRKSADGTFALWSPQNACPRIGGEVQAVAVLKREDDVIEALVEATEALLAQQHATPAANEGP